MGGGWVWTEALKPKFVKHTAKFAWTQLMVSTHFIIMQTIISVQVKLAYSLNEVHWPTFGKCLVISYTTNQKTPTVGLRQ